MVPRMQRAIFFENCVVCWRIKSFSSNKKDSIAAFENNFVDHSVFLLFFAQPSFCLVFNKYGVDIMQERSWYSGIMKPFQGVHVFECGITSLHICIFCTYTLEGLISVEVRNRLSDKNFHKKLDIDFFGKSNN